MLALIFRPDPAEVATEAKEAESGLLRDRREPAKVAEEVTALKADPALDSADDYVAADLSAERNGGNV